MNPALAISLREEVMNLRKKVVKLETAESDNKNLRKELTRLRINAQEEQSKFELEFMNQLSEVVRENAMKVDEINDELRETKKKNLALSEQLRSKGSISETSKPWPTNGSDPRWNEAGSLRRQLQDARQARDDLVKKLDERTEALHGLKKDLQTQSSAEIKRVEDENRSLKNNIASLQKENNELKVALRDSADSKKDARISELQLEIQKLKSFALRTENESRDLTNSSRNDNSADQFREPGRSPPTQQCSDDATGIHENHTSRILEQLEQRLKNASQKNTISCEKSGGDIFTERTLETERIHSLELQREREVSKLEAELSSTKDLLAHEQEKFSKQEQDLKSKLRAFHDALTNSETLRTALAHDKEQLIAETNQITEAKIQLEQKSKRQHQQLKKLQKLVEEHLTNVERNRKDDDMEMQNQKDQVELLERQLLHSQQQVSQLEKAIGKKEAKESTVEHLAMLNLESLQTQLNKLQNELTLRDTQLSEVELKHKKEIIGLETALDSAKLDLRECADTRDKEIEKFKSLVEEKVNEARVLERGKEQLIVSMQDMVKNSREEVDDYQNELVEMNNRLANETRKVSTLRSRLEQSDYPAKEMGRLRKRIAELSRQLELNKMGSENPPEQENRELRRRLKEALQERSVAEDKLQKILLDRGTSGVSSKPVRVLRERNAALKDEVERLTRKLQKQKISADSSRGESNPYVVKPGVTRMTI